MAGGGREKRPRSRGGTPKVPRRSPRNLVASTPQGGSPSSPPTVDPTPPGSQVLQEVLTPPFPQLGDPQRPSISRKSPRLHSQEKENIPEKGGASPPSPIDCSPSLCSLVPPSPPPSPSLPPVAPRVRRSYSRLDVGGGLLGNPLSPIGPPQAPAHSHSIHPPTQAPPPALPGISPLHPERRRRKKVAPIDVEALEAWAAQLNAQLEEAANFKLVVE